ncbi:hypothetical protein [Nigerium massiliense]|uniref:hypothetical protein n=1 Tax=Nigerium massiliense TaxID=1522317 RepID=UPI00058DBF86|nr:hypothetical protein [Nigerium massiliense]
MAATTVLSAVPAVAAPGATALATTVVRDGYGRFTFNARLSHQGVKYHSPDQEDWAPTTWGLSCKKTTHSFASLKSLRASRVIGSAGIESDDKEMILEFTSTAAATRFMNDLATTWRSCDNDYESRNVRVRYDDGRVYGPWTQGLALRNWWQTRPSGRWQNVPGGSMQLVVRKGNRVTMAGIGGELVGDSWNNVGVRKTLLSRVTWSAKRM